MTKVSKTITQIIAFNQAASVYLSTRKDDDSSLCKSLRLVQRKQIPPIFESFNDEISEAKRANCATEPGSGRILRESNGNYSYTKDGERDMNIAVKNLAHKEYDIHQRLCEVNVDDLSVDDMFAFSGFVIDEIKEEDYL